MHKQWDFAIHTAGKHYVFFWRITADQLADENSGSVKLQVTRNASQPGAFEEAYALPLTKINGDWKVDVSAINREMFPGLPR